MVDFEFKENYTLDDLRLIMKILRSEGGCPWDREQTHDSIKMNIIEEAYEVLEAIDCRSGEMLKEELGDLLLQVVFHSRIEEENGGFNFDDVADGICKKLIVRHPHVFGDLSVSDSDEVLKNWDSIKKKTKNQDTFGDTLKSVPKVFPALMRAEKLGKRASRAGVTRNEEVCKNALIQAVASLDKGCTREDLGKILFCTANLAAVMGEDAENVLQDANERFIDDFCKAEEEKSLEGKDLSAFSI